MSKRLRPACDPSPCAPPLAWPLAEQGPQSYAAGQSVRLTAQVQGLGPVFKLKLNLQNMGNKPIQDLEMTFSASDVLYNLQTRVLGVRAKPALCA